MDVIVSLLLSSLCVAVAAIFLYRVLVAPYRVWSNLGISGPRPFPIVGNGLDIKKCGYDTFLKKQVKKFGPVFGFYIGRAKRIGIVDLDLLKEIMVKEFGSFSDRGWLGSVTLAPKALGTSPGLLASTGETWKTGRTTLTPSFSRMKMKLMVPLLKKSSDVLVEKMGEFAESGKSVEVFREYGSFTLETLIATAFGRYVNLQRGEADQLTEAASIVFRESTEGASLEPFVLLIGLSNFPWLEPLLSRAIRRSAAGKAWKLLYGTGTRLIRDRIENPQPPKVKDMVQLMIDATADEKFSGTKKLDSEQMAGFSVDFLLAGYETTANTLSYTTYLLAMNPDVQEKLQAEIDQYFEEEPEISLYEAAQNLKYLDMVLKESLRLYTPVPKVMRQCSKTVTVGGVTIPEGAGVVIPIDVIHHLPQYWPDPYKFDPERFTVEAEANRHQLAHMPFGWGPRSCLGMRFALLETKIALMEILRKYSFARGPETPALLDLERGFTTVPKGGVYVKIIPRK